MSPRRPAPKARDLVEKSLLADSTKLRGVDLRMLGFHGGAARLGAVTLSHALDDEELEPYYEEEAERASAERQARLLAGALWKCSSMLVEGLFDDIFELRALEDENEFPAQAAARAEFVRGDSSVLHRLPPAYAANYTAEFAQKFLVVLADMTTKLAGGWTPPSCLAQELAVHCLADLVEAYADSEGIDLGDDLEGELYEALLEDTDHLFMYPSPSVQEFLGLEPEEVVAALSAVGVAELDFNEWFQPFNPDPDRAVSPYVSYEGYCPRGDDEGGYDIEDGEYHATEQFAPVDRVRAIAAGELLDLTDQAADHGFNCPVAITREAYTAALGEGYEGSGMDDASERIEEVLGDAARAAASSPLLASDMFTNISMFDPRVLRGPLYLDVVAGSSAPGEAVITIQLNKQRRMR